MLLVKLMDHFDDDISHHRIGPNCIRVIKSTTIKKVWISPENLLLAGCSRRFAVNAQEHRNVFITVKTVGNKKSHHNYGRMVRQGRPVGNERFFLHVSGTHLGIDLALSDFLDLSFDSDSGVLVEPGSVSDNQEAGLFRCDSRSGSVGSLQDEFSHLRMVPDRLAIFNEFIITPGNRSRELRLSWDVLLREV